jgi:hypothetical protein
MDHQRVVVEMEGTTRIDSCRLVLAVDMEAEAAISHLLLLRHRGQVMKLNLGVVDMAMMLLL